MFAEVLESHILHPCSENSQVWQVFSSKQSDSEIFSTTLNAINRHLVFLIWGKKRMI